MSGEAGYHYTLHPTGRRTRIEEDHSGRIADYTYDDLYRLTTEAITDPDNGNRTATYQYDATGNRIASTVNGESTSWSYDANDRLTIQSGPDGLTSYSYDANGNLVSETTDGETTNYRYDSRNRMVEVTQPDATTTGYAYDIHGIRTEKTVQGNTTRYLVDHNQQYAQVLAETDDHTPSRLYTRGDDLLSQTNPATGETRHHLHDGLGSTRALTDQTGNETDHYYYEAFGELLHHTGSSDNNYLFAGEQFDADLNLYYNRARYLDTSIGRFTQMDRFQGFQTQPVSLNKYIYAYSDPANLLDPSGNITLGQVLSVGNAAVGRALQNVGAGFAISKTVGGAALRSLGLAAQQSVRAALTRTVGSTAVTEDVYLVGQGGTRVLDFWIQVGQRLAVLEAKYKLPAQTGAAFTRMVGQIRTALTAEEAARRNAQVVLWTFKAPTDAEMALLLGTLGEQAGGVQLVHGLAGLSQWIRFFFILP